MLRQAKMLVFSFGMLFWLMVVLALTMLPGRGLIMVHLASFFGQSDLHGAIGHTGLMASLVIALFIGLSYYLKPKYALLLAVIIVFAVGTSTELYQAGVVGRASTLTDLFGNWTGTFFAGYAMSFISWKGRH